MKRLIVMMAMIAAVMVPALAQGPGQQGRGGHMGPPPGGPNGVFAMLRELNLTDSQREQIKTIVDQNRPTEPPQAMQLEQKLHAAILNNDAASVESIKAQLNEEHSRELDSRIAMLQKIAPILTDEQKKQLLDHPAGPGRGRGRGQGGH